MEARLKALRRIASAKGVSQDSMGVGLSVIESVDISEAISLSEMLLSSI